MTDFLRLVGSSISSGVWSAGEGALDLLKPASSFLLELPRLSINSVSSLLSSTGSGVWLLLSQAWTRTSTQTQPSPSLNYDLLLEKILSSPRFHSAVSSVANSKVEAETEKFRTEISELIQSLEAGREEGGGVTSEEIQSKIESIKAEVTEKIKLMTEEFLRSNLRMQEEISVDQTAHIESLKEKYNALVVESETFQKDMTAQTDTSERINTELKQEIESLKSQISALELEQKDLSQTLQGCCRNQSSVEFTVEQYFSGLLQSVTNTTKTTASVNNQTLAGWVNTFFLAKSELEAKLDVVRAGLEQRLQEEVGQARQGAGEEARQAAEQIMEGVANTLRREFQQRINQTESQVGGAGGLTREEVVNIVKNALIQYDADKTGMFDYALETAGGSVISTRCTQTYVQRTAMYSIFGIPIWYPSNNPRTVIQPGVQPGECWAFKGSTGYIVIKLSDAVVPTRFSMEHISRSMSPSGKIDSAPREFEVVGLRSEKDNDPVQLGSYTYDQSQDPLQYFEVQFPTKESFPYIELDIKSNHGNLNYTCLYRFRVHGVSPSP